jgi:hypothetical protein
LLIGHRSSHRRTRVPSTAPRESPSSSVQALRQASIATEHREVPSTVGFYHRLQLSSSLAATTTRSPPMHRPSMAHQPATSAFGPSHRHRAPPPNHHCHGGPLLVSPSTPLPPKSTPPTVVLLLDLSQPHLINRRRRIGWLSATALPRQQALLSQSWAASPSCWARLGTMWGSAHSQSSTSHLMFDLI